MNSSETVLYATDLTMFSGRLDLIAIVVRLGSVKAFLCVCTERNCWQHYYNHDFDPHRWLESTQNTLFTNIVLLKHQNREIFYFDHRRHKATPTNLFLASCGGISCVQNVSMFQNLYGSTNKLYCAFEVTGHFLQRGIFPHITKAQVKGYKVYGLLLAKVHSFSVMA